MSPSCKPALRLTQLKTSLLLFRLTEARRSLTARVAQVTMLMGGRVAARARAPLQAQSRPNQVDGDTPGGAARTLT